MIFVVEQCKLQLPLGRWEQLSRSHLGAQKKPRKSKSEYNLLHFDFSLKKNLYESTAAKLF